jgi:hypothetical protein
MQLLKRDSVRAFLPALALAFCHGCGGGGEASPGAAAPPPAAPAPPPVNSAPTISGLAAATARVDARYEFQPTASDPDGDALTFSAENLPPWASIDSATGKITGTPGYGDIGEYESITVSVADATHKTSAAPFTVTVSNVVATLRWEKPLAKVDGSPLDDLAGYRIVYGREANDLDHSVFVEGADQTSYEFEYLSPGIWYFAIIGVSSSGLEGPPTTPAMKSI